MSITLLRRSAAALLCVLLLAGLAACSDGSLEDYLSQNPVSLDDSSGGDVPVSPDDVSGSDASGSDVSGTDASTTTTTKATSAPTYESDTGLPENFIGSWSVVDIYQSATASDISADEALRREQLTGLSFGASSFTRYGEVITGALFVVDTKATFADMERFGIQTATLSGPYGANAPITSVEVRTADGQVCTTVFLVNNLTLIAFGSGMNVFSYEIVDAVG